MDFKRYFKNILSVSGLTFIAQAVSLLTTPILTRIFSPEDYGRIAIYSSIIAVLEACASLSYASGIALDREMKDAKATTRLCIFVTCIVGILGMIVIGAINLLMEGDELLRLFIIVLPVMVIFPDITAAYEGWLKRCKQYNYIGVLNIINVVATFLLSLTMGLLGYKATGLLIARCVSAILFAVVVFLVVCLKTDYRKYTATLADLKRQAIVHRRFPLFQMPFIVMNSFSGQLPTIIMNSYFPAQDIGHYAKASSITAIPSQVIGKSVGHVFYQEGALLEREEELKKIALFTFKRLLVLGGLLAFFLASLGPTLFGLVLGDKWHQAGVYSAIMAPLVAAIFINQPLSHMLFIKGKQHMGIIIGVIMLIIRCVTLLTTVYLKLSFADMLYVYTIISTIMYMVINSYFMRLARIKQLQILAWSAVVIIGSWQLGMLAGRLI